MIKWEDLNQDFTSQPFDHKVVEQIALANAEHYLDLRPYMIENPYSCFEKDSIVKVHSLFREMHIRQLLVLNFYTNKLEGIITR